MKINEQTKINTDFKTIGLIVSAVAIGAWFAFGVIERLNALETADHLFQADLLKKAEQEPKNLEMYMLIEHLAGQLEKLAKNIETGKAPYDQQQKLTLDFYKSRIEKLEEHIEKLKDKVLNGKH